MLTPAQVIPFLTHDDPLVRGHALAYFSQCGDPAPVTADDVWAAIDQLGGIGPVTRKLLGGLRDLPQTDRSVRRLLDTLADQAVDDEDADDLQEVARDIDFPLVVAHRDALLNCPELAPFVVERLGRRLALADEPADAVWDQLMALGRKLGQDEQPTTDDDDEYPEEGVDPLVEAAARHVDVLADRAMAVLDDPSAGNDWREVLAIRALGVARHGPAVEAIIDRLTFDDDLLLEESVNALGRIGTDGVVDGLLAFVPAQPLGVRLYAYDVLVRIKRPRSEAAMLQRLGAEADDEVRGNLLYGLCHLGSLAGLDVARPYVAADPNHPESLDLTQGLIATAAMTGATLPEEPRWRERLAARDALAAGRTRKLGRAGLEAFVDAMHERWTGLEDDDAGPAPPPPPLPGEYDPYARIAPIRNDAPKVGRNDPCPCGSGKKYKKCHGAPGGGG